MGSFFLFKCYNSDFLLIFPSFSPAFALMARAGQGRDFFQVISDVEKGNQRENGGSFPGFGSLVGIFAQKNHFEVKEGNTVLRKSFS